MKIVKFNTFIKLNEGINDTPEQYIKIALMKIKSKLEKMFDKQDSGDVQKIGDKNKSSLTDFGVELQSCELSKYSRLQDSVRIKYSDATSLYDLLIAIDLKEAVSEDETKDFSDSDIKKCFIKFKKYDQDEFNLIGEISKNINISDIDEDFLVSLKIEMDKDFGDDEDELEIETE